MKQIDSCFLLVGVFAFAAICQAGNTCIWSGLAGDGKWNTAGNWDVKPADGNGDTVILSSATAATIVNDMGAISLYSLQFASGSAPITLRGDKITLTSTDGSAGYGDAYGKVSAIYAASANATNAIENDIVLPSGTHCFTIGNKAGLEISGVISGAGGIHRRPFVNGTNQGGTLILSGDNTYEGGTTLRGDNSVIASTHALGKAGTTCYMFNANARYYFRAAGDYDYVFGFKEGPLAFHVEANCRFLRKVYDFGASTDFTLYAAQNVTRVDFMGTFGIGGGSGTGAQLGHKYKFDFPLSSSLYFHDAVAMGPITFGVDNNDRKGFSVHFTGSGNSYTGPINALFANIHMYEAGFLNPDESPVLSYPRMENMGCYHMHGFDQTIDHLTTEHLDQSRFIADSGRWFITDKPATLTMKATGSGSANCAFQGPMNLVYDAQGDHTQSITGRTCSISGELIVSNGTFALTGSTTMKNLHGIHVCDGGTFALDVKSSSALAGVVGVTVERGGVFRYVSGTDPLPNDAWIALADGAMLDIPTASTFTTPVLTNGVVVSDGTYQPEDGTSSGALKVPWLKSGSGILTVSLGGAYWRSAADGVWSDSGSWTAVPQSEGETYIMAGGADYTVGVAADAGTYGNLTISRNDGGTTTLAVNAPFGTGRLDGSTPKSGYLTLGKGAKVSVGEGGVWKALSTDAYSAVDFYNLSDGAEFRVDGGVFAASNFCGHVRVGPVSGDNSTTSKVVVADGSFDFFIRESADTWFSIERGGRMDISGGRARFCVNRTSDKCIMHDKGGSLEVSGDGRLEFGGGNAYLSGTTRFSGNARLSGILGKGSTHFYLNPTASDEPAVLEFTDHAGMDTTGFQTYNGIEGAYMFNYWHVNNGVDGTSRVLLDSDGKYMFCSCLYLGLHRGKAELDMKNGDLKTYAYGIVVGGSLPRSATQTAAPNVESVFSMSGGSALIRAGDAWSNKNNIYGCVVGDGSNVTPGLEGLVKGRIELSGGSMTNSVWNSFTAFGIGRGYGEMIQTGGELVRTDNAWFILGMLGGEGVYVMSNGVVNITGNTDVWIGGVSTNTIDKFLPSCPESHEAKGLLGVYGGSFKAANSTIYLGADGTGRLEIGESGEISAKALVVSNAVADVAKSGLGVKFGPTGAGKLTLSGSLALEPGAKLEVDVSDYVGGKNSFRVLSCANSIGRFAEADITVKGDPRLVGLTSVEQTDTALFVRFLRGFTVILR